MDLSSGKTNVDYIDKHGYNDIVKMLEDHKEIFPGIDNAWVGQYRPYISTEVDCESLFNQSGYISQQIGLTQKIRTFERLFISKHRLQRIFCDPKKVEKIYLKKNANNE